MKTDRRAARKLASYARYGALTPIWVPDATQEAVRDLIRHRIDVKRARQRQQLNQFALRHGHLWSRARWTQAHRAWLEDLKFPHAAQQLTLQHALALLDAIDARLAAIDGDIERSLATWQLQPVVESLRALKND